MASFQYGGIVEQVAVTATAGATTTLTNTSKQIQIFTGSSGQTIVLPNATTFSAAGAKFEIYNQSTSALTIQFNGGAAFTDAAGVAYGNLGAKSSLILKLQTNGTSAGTWSVVAPGSGGVGAWVATTPYTTGQIVNYSKQLWIAISGFTSGASFEADIATGGLWQLINTPQIQKNYALIGNNFEDNDTSGWLAFTNTLSSFIPTGTPTIGTGASISLSSQSTGALDGQYSLQNTTATTWTAGQGLISPAFPVDVSQQAKMQQISFDYSPTAGAGNMNFSGTSSNTMACYIYDVTNTTWIQPQGVYNFVQSSGVGRFTGTFQHASNCTSFRLAIFIINANTSGTTTMLFDNFYVGPQVTAQGPAMTDWTSWTPTGSWSTNTTYTGWYKRVGDSLQMIVKLALSGAPTNAGLTVTLPNGLNIDTTKLPGTPGNTPIGYLFGNAATNGFVGSAYYSSATAISALYTGDGVTASIMTRQSMSATAPYTFANGDFVYIYIDPIPIVGWSSNSAMSADTDTRVVAAKVHTATATLTGAYSDVTWTTIDNDSHGAMGAINYTVPVSGYYDFAGSLNFSATTVTAGNFYSLQLFNTTTSTAICESADTVEGTQATAQVPFSFKSIFLNAGTQVKIQAASNATSAPVISASVTKNFWGISRQSGPAVVAATETVALSYQMATAQSITSTGIVKWDTKLVDTHNAYNASTGVWTAPVSGKYVVSYQLFSITSSSGQWQTSIRKNSSAQVRSNPTVTSSGGSGVNANQSLNFQTPFLIQLNAGDTIDIDITQAAAAGTLYASAIDNWMQILRVGN